MATTRLRKSTSTASNGAARAVQLITTADCQPVDYFITAGSFHDSTALQAMQVDLPAGSELYGDSGYTDYDRGAGATGGPLSHRRTG
jgi:IS5 family transposase